MDGAAAQQDHGGDGLGGVEAVGATGDGADLPVGGYLERCRRMWL